MKTFKFFILFLTTIIAISFASCGSDDKDGLDVIDDLDEIIIDDSEIVGTWILQQISNYDGNEFKGSAFTFKRNGILHVEFTTYQTSGVYQVTLVNGQGDYKYSVNKTSKEITIIDSKNNQSNLYKYSFNNQQLRIYYIIENGDTYSWIFEKGN